MRTRMFFLLFAMLVWPAWAVADQMVRIVAPEPEVTIHDNGGNVGVEVAVLGAVGGGTVVVLLLDGNVVASGAKLHFDLTDVDRGEHTLVAQVRTADGTVVGASDQVTFYMWRASRLFPSRR